MQDTFNGQQPDLVPEALLEQLTETLGSIFEGFKQNEEEGDFKEFSNEELGLTFISSSLEDVFLMEDNTLSGKDNLTISHSIVPALQKAIRSKLGVVKVIDRDVSSNTSVQNRRSNQRLGISFSSSLYGSDIEYLSFTRGAKIPMERVWDTLTPENLRKAAGEALKEEIMEQQQSIKNEISSNGVGASSGIIVPDRLP